jgi:hypothetical protein
MAATATADFTVRFIIEPFSFIVDPPDLRSARVPLAAPSRLST